MRGCWVHELIILVSYFCNFRIFLDNSRKIIICRVLLLKLGIWWSEKALACSRPQTLVCILLPAWARKLYEPKIITIKIGWRIFAILNNPLRLYLVPRTELMNVYGRFSVLSAPPSKSLLLLFIGFQASLTEIILTSTSFSTWNSDPEVQCLEYWLVTFDVITVWFPHLNWESIMKLISCDTNFRSFSRSVVLQIIILCISWFFAGPFAGQCTAISSGDFRNGCLY